MGQRRKAAKLRREKDQLIEFPDGILSTIISMLTLKEAVRTSILSKSWRFIWTCHPDLQFDSVSILGSKICTNNISNHQLELDTQKQRCKFIKQVDHFMLQRCKGTKIDSLTIRFHLGKDFASHIDWWIDCAVTKGVENIDLDLSEWSSFKVDRACSTSFLLYEFPCWLLAVPGKKSNVKYLRLGSCNLRTAPSSKCLPSLITVKLQDVNISDQQLENLLSSCLFLKELYLQECRDIVNLNFVGPSLQLKLLSVQNCFRLKKIEIYAKNLVTLEYTGHLITFCFKIAPRLAEAFMNFTGKSRLDGVTYSLTRFASNLPQLKTLNLFSVLVMKTLKLPEDVPTFSNIKQLVLTVYPFDDEDKLYWISYILKAFPLLHMLQLNLFCPSFIKQQKEIERILPECPHRHLTELEVNGVYGNRHEVDLMRYLLDNLVELEVLVVSPCQKIYKGVNNWVYEAASSWYKKRMESFCVWLHAVVPPTIHLKIW